MPAELDRTRDADDIDREPELMRHEAEVIITIAPDDRYARVARTVVASCASLEGFQLDDLGDVRLLVDTAFHVLSTSARGGGDAGPAG